MVSNNPSPSEKEEAIKVLEDLIPADQWEAYAPVMRRAEEMGLRFAMGGGLAYSLYGGHPRNTKDLDVFILPPDHEPYLKLMEEAGFNEYTVVPYDRTWSYRGVKDGFIMDLLWGMLNDRAPFDEAWVKRGWEIPFRGVKIRLLPPEELMWTKMYIVHRDRCDWPDILVILGTRGPELDWSHFLERVGADAPLLGSILSFFRWLHPERAAQFPPWIWEKMGLSPWPEVPDPALIQQRADLIRRGGWFPFCGGECEGV